MSMEPRTRVYSFDRGKYVAISTDVQDSTGLWDTDVKWYKQFGAGPRRLLTSAPAQFVEALRLEEEG